MKDWDNNYWQGRSKQKIESIYETIGYMVKLLLSFGFVYLLIKLILNSFY